MPDGPAWPHLNVDRRLLVGEARHASPRVGAVAPAAQEAGNILEVHPGAAS